MQALCKQSSFRLENSRRQQRQVPVLQAGFRLYILSCSISNARMHMQASQNDELALILLTKLDALLEVLSVEISKG